jgi:hypothetical protein
MQIAYNIVIPLTLISIIFVLKVQEGVGKGSAMAVYTVYVSGADHFHQNERKTSNLHHRLDPLLLVHYSHLWALMQIEISV